MYLEWEQMDLMVDQRDQVCLEMVHHLMIEWEHMDLMVDEKDQVSLEMVHHLMIGQMSLEFG